MSSLSKVRDPEVASLPSRSEALSARYGQGFATLSVDEGLSIIAVATFLSRPDRAVFWARDGSMLHDPEIDATKPLNEVIIERFVRDANQKLGYKPWRDGNLPGDADVFHTMHSLPEGRALWRLTQPGADKPPQVTYNGETFRNDSYASTELLIARLAGEYSRRASGRIFVAANDAEPDTFFRSVELPNLLSNPLLRGVDVLDFRAQQSMEELGQSDPGSLGTSRFAGPGFQLEQRSFASVGEWSEWQRDQWLGASLARLMQHIDPGARRQQRIPGLDLEQQALSADYCRARFLCEAQVALRDLVNLGSAGGAGNPEAPGAELRRLRVCASVLGRFPEIARPLEDPSAADMFAKFMIKEREPDVDRRDRMLDRLWSDRGACSEYSLSAARDLSERIRARVSGAGGGGR